MNRFVVHVLGLIEPFFLHRRLRRRFLFEHITPVDVNLGEQLTVVS